MKHTIFSILQSIQNSLDQAARSLGDSTVEVVLERPREAAHGDFASPLAMNLAKLWKRSPLSIAQDILKTARFDPDLVQKAEVAPPGYINITLHPNALFSVLETALSEDKDYGRNDRSRGQKVILEFVSANPTGPLNIVSARAAALGDSIANLIQHSGGEVVREYYVNDSGVQARLFGESLLAACDRLQGKDTQAPENGYQGAYMEDLARDYLALPDRPDASRWGMDRVLQWHRLSLERYGVSFDNWFSEKSGLHDTGLVAQTVADLKKAGLTYEKDGALWIRVSDFGSPKDEVLVKSDGQPAYFAADIAYHLLKFRNGFTKVVDIWGPDHHGHILRMTSALQAAGCPVENFQVLIAQQVNLLEAGEKVKMSKREGKFVTMDELLDKVGKDAARFFFVMRGANTHLDFDIEVAKKQTEENPVYYIQYAHARICSLLKKTAERGYHPALAASDMASLREDEALLLLKQIMEYPKWVAESGKAYEPHRIVVYLQTLASDFHFFYSKNRILDAPKDVAGARLALALGVKLVLRNALALLGVSAPEQM